MTASRIYNISDIYNTTYTIHHNTTHIYIYTHTYILLSFECFAVLCGGTSLSPLNHRVFIVSEEMLLKNLALMGQCFLTIGFEVQGCELRARARGGFARVTG